MRLNLSLSIGGTSVAARTFLLLVGVLTLTNCGSIVKHPEIDQVKKLGIVSIYSPANVMRSGSPRVLIRGFNDESRKQVALQSYRHYQKVFEKLGFKVVNYKTFTGTEAYREFFVWKNPTSNESIGKAITFLNKVSNAARRYGYFSPPGMYPVPIDQEDDKNTTTYNFSTGKTTRGTPTIQNLARFAKKFGLDAAAVVYTDYCYESGMWSVGGTGEARITAGVSIKAVNPEGVKVIDMPVQARCGGQRFESSTTVGQIGGAVLYNRNSAKMKKMFAESSYLSSEWAFQRIDAAMRKK
jgi:hypothetical protein